MNEKMIIVNGKEFSESTIANALEKQCGVVFEKPEPKWIVAICDDHDPRIILNLAALNKNAKFVLRKAIEKGSQWVSFGKGGFYGTKSNTNNGLTFYPKVKIVF